MKILIVRHGQSVKVEDFSHIDPTDRTRPLTKKGIKRFEKAVKSLPYLFQELDYIFTSEYTRAIETAKILNSAYPKAKLFKSPLLNPDSPAKKILEVLSECDEEDHIALVGHNPGISQVVDFLLAGDMFHITSFKKGSVCLIEKKLSNGELKWLLEQSQLEMLSASPLLSE